MRHVAILCTCLFYLSGCFGFSFANDGSNGAGPSANANINDDRIACGVEGFYLDDELLISVDESEILDRDECTSWSLNVTSSNYTACCSGHCCTWGSSEGSDGLAAAGEPCSWSGMCEFGLTCFTETEGASSGICRLGKLGNDCDTKHLCEESLYCKHVGGNATCQGFVAVEGQLCEQGSPDPCLDPLTCVCPPGYDCRCWDGSEGDFCVDGTCQDGLKCVDDEPGKKSELGPVCTSGEEGSRCDGNADCADGLLCYGLTETEYCVTALGEGEYCTPGSSSAVCSSKLFCNDAASPPICLPAGTDDSPCLADDYCEVGWHCHEGLEVCLDGSPGDPCSDNADCDSGVSCLPHGDEMLCTTLLAKFATCNPDDDSSQCGPGLHCNAGLDPPKCLTLGVDEDACASDADCAAGYTCLLELALCFDGRDGDPCSTDDHCAPGYHCPLALAHCYDGNTGDKCLNDNHCAAGYACNLDIKQCFAGNHGVACETDADCDEALFCMSIAGQSACFEFLGEGAPCDPLMTPFAACDLGLVCDESVDPPACAALPLAEE